MKTINNSLKGALNSKGDYMCTEEEKAENKSLCIELRGKINEIIGEYLILNKDAVNEQDYESCIDYQTSLYSWFAAPYINSRNFKGNEEIFTFVECGINPHGYNAIEIKRHFVFSLELSGKAKYKYWRRWDDQILVKKYILADNVEDLIYEVELYFKNQFSRKIENLNKELNREYVHNF